MQNEILFTAIILFNVLLGILLIRSERRLERVFRRLRFLHERLETVEKFNGVGLTYTDIQEKNG